MSDTVDNVREAVDRLDAIADPITRAMAQDALAAVMDMYGAGLERIGAILSESGAAGAEVREALLADGIVASLLLIHDLYPVDLETRVAEALDGVRQDVEFLGVVDGVAQLRASATLGPAITRALDERAPDLSGIEILTDAHRCELCGVGLSEGHRHVLHLVDRSILCSCEPCWALKAGDPNLASCGTRVAWLEDFELDDQLWAAFGVPVALAFFLRTGNGVAAIYPSPAGATECELELPAWERLAAVNPVLDGLQPDSEALVVNRLAIPHQFAIAPIDECYRLVGLIKSQWEGISGGGAVERAVPEFFKRLQERVA